MKSNKRYKLLLLFVFFNVNFSFSQTCITSNLKYASEFLDNSNYINWSYDSPFLYFLGTDTLRPNRIGLYYSDGLTNATSPLVEFPLNGFYGFAGDAASYNRCYFSNKIAFLASDSVHGFELWTSDGTAAGTKMIIDYDTYPTVYGTANLYPEYLKLVGNKVFFFGRVLNVDPNTSQGMRRSLYMLDTTSLVISNTNIANTFELDTRNRDNMVVIGSDYFFLAKDDIYSTAYYQLWKTNGDDAGTIKITDVSSGQTVEVLSSFANYLVYQIKDYGAQKGKIYLFDNTTNQSELIREFDKGEYSSYTFSKDAVLGNAMYFYYNSNNVGALYKLDFSSKSISEVKRLLSNSGSHAAKQFLVKFKNKIIYSEFNPISYAYILRLVNEMGVDTLFSDLTYNTSYGIKGAGELPFAPIEFGSRLFFSSKTGLGTGNLGVWVSDGDTTFPWVDLNTVNYSNSITSPVIKMKSGLIVSGPHCNYQNTMSYNKNSFWVLDTTILSIGIMKKEVERNIKIFPNPADSELFIDLGDLQIEKIEIFNSIGIRCDLITNGFRRISLLNYTQGVYFVDLTDKNGYKYVKRFVVLH